MGGALSIPLTALAGLAFGYALLQAIRVYVDTRDRTDIWLYVSWSTFLAALISLAHVVRGICLTGRCPVGGNALVQAELLLVLLTMAMALVTIQRVKRETEAGRYNR